MNLNFYIIVIFELLRLCFVSVCNKYFLLYFCVFFHAYVYVCLSLLSMIGRQRNIFLYVWWLWGSNLVAKCLLSSGQLIGNFLYTYFLVLSTIGYVTLIFIWHSTHMLRMEALGHIDDEIVSCLVSDFYLDVVLVDIDLILCCFLSFSSSCVDIWALEMFC